jgi:sodium-dependent phosphate cotransporter
LGISSLFTQDSKGFTVLGSFIVVALGVFLIWFVYSWYRRGLRDSIAARFVKRQRRIDAIETLPDDMESLKANVEALKKHTGLPEESEDANKTVDEVEA